MLFELDMSSVSTSGLASSEGTAGEASSEGTSGLASSTSSLDSISAFVFSTSVLPRTISSFCMGSLSSAKEALIIKKERKINIKYDIVPTIK